MTWTNVTKNLFLALVGPLASTYYYPYLMVSSVVQIHNFIWDHCIINVWRDSQPIWTLFIEGLQILNIFEKQVGVKGCDVLVN
jgi:hypothetical protein